MLLDEHKNLSYQQAAVADIHQSHWSAVLTTHTFHVLDLTLASDRVTVALCTCIATIRATDGGTSADPRLTLVTCRQVAANHVGN